MADIYKKISEYNELAELDASGKMLVAQSDETYSVGADTMADFVKGRITMDNTPTQGSSNPVTSNGVYNGIRSYKISDRSTDQGMIFNDWIMLQHNGGNEYKIQAKYALGMAGFGDSVPTPNSANVVWSGGVYDAIEDAKSSLSSEIQTVQSATGDEIDTNSTLVNDLESLIDYGYGTPYEQTEVPGGTWKTAIGLKRIGPRVILNRSAVGSAQVFIKLSGAVTLYSTNASVDAWTGGVSLISGHKYRAECKLVSGESIRDEDVGQRPPSIQVIKPGAHTSVGEYTATSTTTTVDFTAESGATYNIALFMGRNKYTFANAVLLVTLTDLTDNQVYQLQEAVEALQDEQSGAVPDYYMEDDYLPNRAKAVNEIAAGIGRQSVRTIFFTDYHLEDNARVSPVLMRYLIGHTTIRNVMFGGDAYNHDYTSKAGGVALLASFARDFSAIREAANFYGITGNHEMNNADSSHSASELSPAVAYNLFNEPISYKIHSLWPETNTNTFYVDDDAAQVRYYGIDCGSGALIAIGVIRAVAASFATVPEGYAVVLFSHTGIGEYTNDDTVTPPVYTATALTDRMECIMECAAALNDGLTKTVQITISGTTYNVQCSYSGKARTVVGAITGHRHIDTYYIYDSRFPVIATACDTGAYRDTLPLRVAGTITEQAFDVVQIDIATKRIYCTRIGAGADRTFSFGDGAGPIEV